MSRFQLENEELREQLQRSEALRETQRQYIMTLDRKVQFLQAENTVRPKLV